MSSSMLIAALNADRRDRWTARAVTVLVLFGGLSSGAMFTALLVAA